MDVPLVFDQEKFKSDISVNKFIFVAEQHNWHFPTLNSIGEVATESFQTKNSYDIKGAVWLSDTPNPKNKGGAIIRYQSKKWKVINMHHVYFN